MFFNCRNKSLWQIAAEIEKPRLKLGATTLGLSYRSRNRPIEVASGWTQSNKLGAWQLILSNSSKMHEHHVVMRSV